MKMGAKEVVKYYQSIMGTQILPSLSHELWCQRTHRAWHSSWWCPRVPWGSHTTWECPSFIWLTSLLCCGAEMDTPGHSWGWAPSLQCGHPPLTTWLRHFSWADAQFPAGSTSSPHLPLCERPCTAGTLRFNHFYSCWDHPGLLLWHYVPLYWGYFTALHL